MIAHTAVTDNAVAATCETAGKTEGSHCSVCGKILVQQTIIPANGHTFDSDTWQTDSEKHWHECSVCHEIIGETAHIKDSGTVTKQPTVEETGTKEYKCTVCKYVMETETLDKLTPTHVHSYDIVKYDSQKHWRECSCGEKENDGETHTLTDSVTKKATCTEKGINTRTCSCGYSTTEEIPMIAHTVVTDNAVAATCETTGKTEGSHCSVCSTVITQQTEIPALGHDWGEWSITQNPTQTEKGTAQRICKNDNSHKNTIDVANRYGRKSAVLNRPAQLTARRYIHLFTEQ
jgi:hypothetical protein